MSPKGKLIAAEDTPLPIKAILVSPVTARDGYERLWREILVRATLDALGFTGEGFDIGAHNQIIRSARNFWAVDITLERYFELANLDVEPVRRTILAVPPVYKDETKTRGKT